MPLDEASKFLAWLATGVNHDDVASLGIQLPANGNEPFAVT